MGGVVDLYALGFLIIFFYSAFEFQFFCSAMTLIPLNRHTRARVILCLFLCSCVVFFVLGPFNSLLVHRNCSV